MFFTLKEIIKWFGLTAFEIWLNLVTLFVFSIVAVLKHEEVITVSWWKVFVPIFAADGLNAYFCGIVFIRMYKDAKYRAAGMRLLSSLALLICIFVFKLLLCQKLNKDMDYNYSEVFAPVFVVLQILMLRACQTH